MTLRVSESDDGECAKGPLYGWASLLVLPPFHPRLIQPQILIPKLQAGIVICACIVRGSTPLIPHYTLDPSSTNPKLWAEPLPGHLWLEEPKPQNLNPKLQAESLPGHVPFEDSEDGSHLER